MKKKSWFLLFCVAFMLPDMYAQDSYFPEGMTWEFLVGAESPGTYCQKDICLLKGDTLIGEKTYHKIVHNDTHIVPINAEGKKIFAHINHNDLLLYDFELEIGDPIPVYEPEEYTIREYAFVTRTDSITLSDGRRAKRIEYDNLRRDIEYVGGEYGILAPLVYPDISTCGAHLMCCSLNENIIYELFSGCCDIIREQLHQDISNVQIAPSAIVKFLQDRHIYIQRGEHFYTVQGQEIEVK